MRLRERFFSRKMGAGLDPVRHLGVPRHPPLHRLNLKSVCHKRGPLPGGDATTGLLQEAPIQTTGLHHDPRRLDQLGPDHSPSHVRMVSSNNSVCSKMFIALRSFTHLFVGFEYLLYLLQSFAFRFWNETVHKERADETASGKERERCVHPQIHFHHLKDFTRHGL